MVTRPYHCWLGWTVGFVLFGLLSLPAALPHPLGNFSINHYTRLQINATVIEVYYVVDMAEIPTFQQMQESGIVPEPGHASLETYLTHQSEVLQQGLVVQVNGQRLLLHEVSRNILFPPGAGGLPTLKLGLVYHADLNTITTSEPDHLFYRDDNFPGRAGWKEIIAVAQSGSTILQSSVPDIDRSRALTDYPTDVRHSPPQVVEARVRFTRHAVLPLTALSGPPALAMNRQATPRSAFTELVTTQQSSVSVVALALLIAAGLGAFHALEPGHGKTVVAAYLVGTRGTAWHALYLGLIVTATHTAGVYLLGVGTLYASHYIVPERLYPWLGALSGGLIAVLGASLFVRRYAGQSHAYTPGPGPHHKHEPHHAHAHANMHVHGGSHQHHSHAAAMPQHHHHHMPTDEHVSPRALLTLGITGGIVPCPAALVVLLSALSLHRVGFGLLLIVAFSVGLAAVLIAIGLLMVYARQFMARFQGEGVLIRRWLPLTSAAVITLLGVAMAIQALLSAGLLQGRLSS